MSLRQFQNMFDDSKRTKQGKIIYWEIFRHTNWMKIQPDIKWITDLIFFYNHKVVFSSHQLKMWKFSFPKEHEKIVATFSFRLWPTNALNIITFKKQKSFAGKGYVKTGQVSIKDDSKIDLPKN